MGSDKQWGLFPCPHASEMMVPRRSGWCAGKVKGSGSCRLEFKLSPFSCDFVQSVPLSRGIQSGAATCSGSHSLAELGCEHGSGSAHSVILIAH